MSGARGFAMVPAWLMAKKPKGNDVLIYCTLASHGSWNPGTGVYDDCKPSIDLMCEETGLSRSSVKRALDNLLKLGGVKRTLQFTEEGDPAPSLYQVIFGQVIEPGEGVGSQVDRPQAAEKRGRSRGGRSTDEPTGSVHGWTEGRSTDEPTVGPQVDRNQEPLNQEPMTQSSDLASQGRRADSGDAQPDGQITIDGGVETPPDTAQRELQNTAMGLARGWIDFRTENGCPVVARGRTVPLNAIANLVLPALLSGYGENEIKHALAWTDTGIPSVHQFDTALGRVRAGWRPGRSWKPGDGHVSAGRQRAGSGAMANTNRHVDDIPEEQRTEENPFNRASRQSDYVTEGAVA